MRAGSWALAAVIGMVACGSDGAGPGGTPIPAELEGVWVAEPQCRPQCGFTLSAVANPADSVNVTREPYGFEVEIGMTRSGVFRLTWRPGGTEQGSARAEGGLLIITSAGNPPDTLEYTLADPYLHLRFRKTFASIDFTGDGVPDPAHARGTFRRR